MSHKLDLRDVEMNVFRSTFQDGLMELYLGVVFLSFGSGRVLDTLHLSDDARLVAGTIGMVVVVMGLVLLREYVVVPRRGRVHFSSQRLQRQQRTAWAVIISLYAVMGILVALGTAHLSIGKWGVLAIFGFAIVLPLWLPAYFLRIPRLFAYSALIVAALAIGYALGSGGAGLIASGAIMAGIGIVRLVRFVHEHPLPQVADAEAANGHV